MFIVKLVQRQDDEALSKIHAFACNSYVAIRRPIGQLDTIMLRMPEGAEDYNLGEGETFTHAFIENNQGQTIDRIG